MNQRRLKKGFKEAEKITQHFAKTFYWASIFLPKEKRLASYSIYSICRLSDESVDNPQGSNPNKTLDRIKTDIELAYSSETPADNTLFSFQQTVRKYNIPKGLFLELIEGMQMDLIKNRYENFNQLYEYCYKAAGVVGLIILQIFGYSNPRAKDHAIKLGIAMQLTNILRDIKEDAQRNRIYLPLDEIESYGLSTEDILRGNISTKFIALMRKQISRAKEFYQASEPGINMVADKNASLTARLMSKMYSGILNEIEINNYDVFLERAHLNILKKILVIFKALKNRSK